MTNLAQAQNLYGLGGTAIGFSVDYQVRRIALDTAASLLGSSTSSPEILTDAAKKIEAYLRGENSKN